MKHKYWLSAAVILAGLTFSCSSPKSSDEEAGLVQ